MIMRLSHTIDQLSSFFRRLSLLQKFSVAVILLIVMVTVAVNALIITYQRSSLRSEMEKSHSLLTRNLARDAREPLIFMDPLRLDELVRTIDQTPGCAYASITDGSGRVIAHTDRKLLGTPLPDSLKERASVVLVHGTEQTRDVPDESVKELLVPVRAAEEVVGMAIVGFSRSDTDAVIEQGLRDLKSSIFFISAGVMVLGIGGAYLLARFLTVPIKNLKGRMERVQSGDLDAEVPNEHLLNCWEVRDCERKDCPAYGKKRCWTIPGTLCDGEPRPDLFEKFLVCRTCVVYRESCGDELGELVEAFNQMVVKLRESIAQLEEAGRERSRLEKLSALGEMSMTVAHEIKNPLNAIRGAVSYLQDNFKGEVLKEFLSIIEDETKRLNEIVMSFLRYSRPTPLQPEFCDINRVVAETVDLVRQEATENDVEVVMSLGEKVPGLYVDPQQMKQALLNMLVNALDATGPGDTVSVSTEVLESRVRITVGDNGTGISEEVLPQLFKPFFTTKTRGSGLGLACVERIVKDHRGDIGVRSAVGKGTEFTITLPVVHGRN